MTDERSDEGNGEEHQEGRADPRSPAGRQVREGEGKSDGRKQGAAYQGAFEAVAAILIAGFAGNFADEYFGTSPRYLIAGIIIGFGSFVLRLVRLGRALQSDAVENDSGEK